MYTQFSYLQKNMQHILKLFFPIEMYWIAKNCHINNIFNSIKQYIASKYINVVT